MRAARGVGAAVLLALGTALAGCGGAVQEPVVRFEGLRVGGLGLEGGHIMVQVGVVNPNRFGLQARDVEYDLDLRATGGEEWIDLAEGVYSEEIVVGGRDSVIVEIPVEFTYRQLGPALRSMMNRGSVDVRVEGAVQLTEPVGRRIPFRRQQAVTLSGE
ncbi:MAG TPA: LEA type 2 family protein [Longimicrobiales bacterium]|nr:LEA type 2 family protein [Longimicrobiales bacterium]